MASGTQTTPEYMRMYRARRKAEGRPIPSGTRWAKRERRARERNRYVPDPDDYSHPLSDVSVGP